MNGRKNLQAVLNHKQGDRMAVDFGATAVSGIHVKCVGSLREYYSLPKRPIKVIEPYQMLGEIDDELQEIMGVSVVGCLGINTFFGFKSENFKPYQTLWGQEVLVPEKFNTTRDENGNELIYPEGDTTASPSGIMPGSGYFFDAVIRQKEIVEDDLKPDDNLEEYSYLSETDLKAYKKIADKLSKSGKGIVLNIGGSAMGDISMVPGTSLKDPKGIRDIAEWYMSTIIRPGYIHEVFEKQTEIAIENFKKIYSTIGNDIDAVFVCGTDFGTQNSLFCSKEQFESMYMPYYKKMNDWIHLNTKWKSFKHSCGAIEPLLPSIIESGFDILNPLQFSADGMDTKLLKDKYGKDITFWGGGVDTQKTLPFGTPEQVRDEVLKQCEILNRDGGFVFNTVHNIQANTPVENVAAMIAAVNEFGG